MMKGLSNAIDQTNTPDEPALVLIVDKIQREAGPSFANQLEKLFESHLALCLDDDVFDNCLVLFEV